jgi:hypothetical protein
MDALEAALAELPSIDAEEVATVAQRAGNSSQGTPPRPRAEDTIGTARYAVEFLRVIAAVLAEQERRT